MIIVNKDTYISQVNTLSNYGADEILRLNNSSSIVLEFNNFLNNSHELRLFIADAYLPNFTYDNTPFLSVKLRVKGYSFSMQEGYGTELNPTNEGFSYFSQSVLPTALYDEEIYATVSNYPLKRRLFRIPLIDLYNSANFFIISLEETASFNFFSRQTRTIFVPYAANTSSLTYPPFYIDFSYDTRFDEEGIFVKAWQRRQPIATRDYTSQSLTYINLSEVYFDIYVYDFITAEEHYYTSLKPTAYTMSWYFIDLSKINLSRTQFLRLKPQGSLNEIFISTLNRFSRL